MTVDELLRSVAGGDRQAFAVLYDETAATAYGLIRRVVRNDAIAEEVLQEVMLEVWRTAPRYDMSRGGARAWIHTIAHRRAVDRVRTEAAARRRDVAADRPDRPFDEVGELVDRAADRALVNERMSALTDKQRETIELSYFEGLTQREISARLDVPVNTVKTRMRDGLVRLRAVYEAPR